RGPLIPGAGVSQLREAAQRTRQGLLEGDGDPVEDEHGTELSAPNYSRQAISQRIAARSPQKSASSRYLALFGVSRSRSSGVSMSRAALSMGTRTTRSGLRWKRVLAPRSPRRAARSRKLELGKIAGA